MSSEVEGWDGLVWRSGLTDCLLRCPLLCARVALPLFSSQSIVVGVREGRTIFDNLTKVRSREG